jgi:pimeloyl-ACP methyl ester carboxylesterase
MRAPVNGIELEYEVFGPEDGVPLLLITGVSVQMIWWWDDFIAKFVERGYRVIRHDNRDAGLSTHFHHIDADAAFAEAPYTLSALAADSVGLLDHLGIDRAHIVGQSMGGMIVQTIALEHPERVLSMCSISSSTGDLSVGGSDPTVMVGLKAAGPPASTRDEAGDWYVQDWIAIAGPKYPCDEARTRYVGMRAWDREHGSLGALRQISAILASGDRTPRLGEIKVPVLVIHGTADPLCAVSGGHATAKAIPHSELRIVEGMGHDIPPPLWDDFVDWIHTNATRKESLTHRGLPKERTQRV